MRHFLKKLIPLVLALGILISIGWYFLVYDTTLTRDLLLTQARKFEQNDKPSIAVFLYNLAYMQSGNSESVAIELAEQFISLGNYSKAEATLTKAIQDGGGIEVYIALCKTYVQQDKLLDAVTMLDKVGNKQIKQQLEQMRPAAPEANFPSGNYAQYLSVTISAENAKLYVSTDLDHPSVKDDPYTGAIRLPNGRTTIYAISIGENGLVSPMAIYQYNISRVVEEVFFTDGYIEAALREQLQIPQPKPIYSDMLWQIDNFTMPSLAQSCADLKWLTNLKTLVIKDASFTDFSPLASLSSLTSLTVVNTPIANSDLSFLANMQALTRLTLSGCRISTIADLAGVNSLQYLDLSSNTIRNLSALAGMSALTELDLSNNALISLQDIQGLTALEILDVSYNSLATTSHASTLVNLTLLDVSSNNLMKLEGIGTLTNLIHFSAAYNNLIDVNILETCTKLQTMDISHNTIINIQMLSKLPDLQELDFSYNEVTRLPEFSLTCSLRIIRGEHNLLTTLDRLAGLRNLTHVYMDYNVQVSNIDKLVNCPALKEVNVYGSRVTNITKLADAGILVHYTPKP